MVLTVISKDFNVLGFWEGIKKLRVTRKFIGPSTFELTVPLDDISSELFQAGNFFYFDVGSVQGVDAFFIENRKFSEKGGVETLVLIGRDASSLLANRMIMGTVNYIDKTANYCIKDIFLQNFKTGNRIIPNLEWGTKQAMGKTLSFQNSYGYVLDQYKKICETANIGFSVKWSTSSSKFYLNTYNPVNRSLEQTVNRPVVFSKENDNVTATAYQEDFTPYKTTAVVAGEGEESNRKIVLVNDSNAGYDRKELFVDARDLQSKIKNSDGTEKTLTTAEYEKVLTQRGLEKLAEQDVKRNYDVDIKINVEGSIYNKDWFLGDIVTVKQERWGVISTEQITAVEETYEGNKISINPVLGNRILNVIDKLRNGIK